MRKKKVKLFTCKVTDLIVSLIHEMWQYWYVWAGNMSSKLCDLHDDLISPKWSVSVNLPPFSIPHFWWWVDNWYHMPRYKILQLAQENLGIWVTHQNYFQSLIDHVHCAFSCLFFRHISTFLHCIAPLITYVDIVCAL